MSSVFLIAGGVVTALGLLGSNLAWVAGGAVAIGVGLFLRSRETGRSG